MDGGEEGREESERRVGVKEEGGDKEEHREEREEEAERRAKTKMSVRGVQRGGEEGDRKEEIFVENKG